MTELSFLIELLLNHELPKPTKDLVAQRIKSVESLLEDKLYTEKYLGVYKQAEANYTLLPRAPHPGVQATHSPEPVKEIAQTPETRQALMDRQAAILGAGRPPEKGQTSPRKW